MKYLRTEDFQVDQIIVPKRLRPTDQAYVEIIAESMRERGQDEPIRVALLERPTLVFGAHRHAAAQLLGWPTIRAELVEAETDRPDLELRLSEIDENLIRHELNPLDRAIFLAERKRVYEELHPETRRGGNRRGRKSDQTANVAVWSFSKETAKRTRLSERLIRRATAISSALAPDVRNRIAGTRLAAKEGELHRLARHDPALQRRIVEMMLDAADLAPTVEEAVRRIRGDQAPDPVEVGFQRLVGLWAKVPPSAREQFIAFLKGSGTVR